MTTLRDAMLVCEQHIYDALDAITGDIDAFVAEERQVRWHSLVGNEHPLIASLGDGHMVFGFGLYLDTLDPCFVATVEAGMVASVGVEMSMFYAHAWAEDSVYPQGDVEESAAAMDLAACLYARDWLYDVQQRLAAKTVEALD